MPMIELLSPSDVRFSNDFIPLWAASYYPDDDRSRRAFIALGRWEAAQAGSEHSEIWDAGLKKIMKAARQRHVAGCVAIALMQLARWYPPASQGKAVAIVAEHFADEKSMTLTRKPFTSHPRDVRRAFQRFKNSVHISAAWHFMDDKEYKKIMSGCIESMKLLTDYAGLIQIELDGILGHDNWSPHLIPESYYKPSVRLVMKQLEPWAVNIIKAKSPPDKGLRGYSDL
jgi:hypothetical protein